MMKRPPGAAAMWRMNATGYYIAEYPNRVQRYTVWYKHKAVYFTTTLEHAQAYCNRQPLEVGR